jgi:hypothetical protein
MPVMMRHKREGFALLIVLLGVVAVAALATTALETSSDEMAAARAARASTSALFLADAGVRATQVSWPSGASSLAIGGSFVDTTTIADGGRYIRTIYRRDNGGSLRVYALNVESKSTGALGGEATVQIWLSSAPPSRFLGAINSNTSVAISSSGSVDSYDSSVGLYNVAGNRYATGDVYANGNMTMSGSSSVSGNVSVGGTFTDASSGSASGTVTTNAAAITYPIDACPATAYSPIPAAPQGNVSLSSGKISSGDSLRINVSGDYYWKEVSLSGGGKLILPDGVAAKIYISSRFTVSGGGGVNNRGKLASNLSIIYCDDGVTNPADWTLSGGTEGYFTVYNPATRVSLTGSSPVYGAIVAGQFVSSGGSAIHFDRALLANTGQPNLIGRSWFQVLR